MAFDNMSDLCPAQNAKTSIFGHPHLRPKAAQRDVETHFKRVVKGRKCECPYLIRSYKLF